MGGGGEVAMVEWSGPRLGNLEVRCLNPMLGILFQEEFKSNSQTTFMPKAPSEWRWISHRQNDQMDARASKHAHVASSQNE